MADQSNSSSVKYQPSDWLYLPTNTAITKWPWLHLKVDQWQYLANRVARLDVFTARLEEINWVVIAFGFLGSLLAILTVCNIRKQAFTSFYAVMLAVSILDIWFLALKSSRQCVAKMTDVSLATKDYYVFASGTVYSCSLMADMLTLALSFERYIALAAPVFHRGLAKAKKQFAWFVVVAFSAVIASTRSHYAFVNYYYTNKVIAGQSWFVGLCYFSDTVIPFLLTCLMLFLVGGIARVVFKRYRQRSRVTNTAAGSGGQNQLPTKRDGATASVDQEMKTISLLAALLIMYFICQIGYILYDVSSKVFDKQTLEYSDSYDQVLHYVVMYEFYIVCAIFSGTFEIVSRSLAFYAYIVFSKRFRRDFMHLLVRALGCCCPSLFNVWSETNKTTVMPFNSTAIGRPSVSVRQTNVDMPNVDG